MKLDGNIGCMDAMRYWPHLYKTLNPCIYISLGSNSVDPAVLDQACVGTELRYKMTQKNL